MLRPSLWGWTLLGKILNRIPKALDTVLFRLAFPLYKLCYTKELGRIADHIQKSKIHSAPSIQKIYQNLWCNGFDSLRFLHHKRETLERVHIVNESVIQQALANHYPIVVASIHGGAFEMLHRILVRYGKPVHLIASPFRLNSFTRYLENLRSHTHIQVHPPSKAAWTLKRLIRNQEILAVMLDQSRDPEGNRVNLLGRPTRLFFRLPQEACQWGACVVTFRTYREQDQHYIRFETLYPPFTPPQEMAQCLEKEVESWIQEHPEQWTWNYPGNWALTESKAPRANA